MIRAAAAAIALVECLGCTVQGSTPESTQTVTVFAAVSLQTSFDRMALRIEAMHKPTPVFSYAGTQTLTAQLTEGAQADVFASADTAHMTTIQNAGLTAGAPKLFARNSLEIAVAPGNPKGIHALSDLSRPGLVVVLADPSVPAGKYAQQVLAKAHVTVRPSSLEPQVTGVVSKIALGEADAGIVYETDVRASRKVAGVAIPNDQNVIADYAIAPLKSARNPSGAIAFIAFVISNEGILILRDAGFEVA